MGYNVILVGIASAQMGSLCSTSCDIDTLVSEETEKNNSLSNENEFKYKIERRYSDDVILASNFSGIKRRYNRRANRLSIFK